MTATLLTLMVLHILLFHVDEYYFHRKRTLCRKEVVSMFVDGALYLPPLAIAIFAPFDELWSSLFIALAILSCLSVVKNELFFNNEMSRYERLTHASLYVLHPVLLYTFYISWRDDYFAHNLYFWMVQITYLGFGFKTLTHQLIYWNYLREDCV